ncbi:hypothetical protein ACIQFP_10500 [Nocardiopsis alba]|uniref:hypothetical protein n=1 Tax=Nocardiopsis alba TaxID=53437 RepID=UPI0037FAE5C4
MASIGTIKRGGSRFYVDRDDATRDPLPGVTSIVDMLNKPFLQFWAAKLTAELAIDSLDYIGAMAERDRQGAVDYLKGASRRYTKQRADVGSSAHDIFERLARGEHVGRVHPDVAPHAAHFREFLEKVNPELVRAEDVAWSNTHQYAGSFDAIMNVWFREEHGRLVPTPDRSGDPHTLMVDYKTSKSAYPTVALQMAAYAHSDYLVDANGDRHPHPEYDGGAVLHITESGWQMIPVDIGSRVFAHFLSLRDAFEWDRQTSRKVLGKPIASGGALVTGTERRAN